jgi:F-type H+-transporting ATPase subunit epsilon
MTSASSMRLQVVTPDAIVVDTPTTKVSTEAVDGSFTLLPRHVDVVAALVPGLLAYVVDDAERLVAVDRGILVKRGRSVRVATTAAIPGDDVIGLQRALRASYRESTESERRARTAIAHLETDAVRRLMELEDHA